MRAAQRPDLTVGSRLWPTLVAYGRSVRDDDCADPDHRGQRLSARARGTTKRASRSSLKYNVSKLRVLWRRPALDTELTERIYSESDIGRGIATTVAGAAGLATYHYWNDWVVAAFVTIIIFPVAKILASAIHSLWSRSRQRSDSRGQIEELFEKLGAEEKHVVQAFVWHGGSVITWGEVLSGRAGRARATCLAGGTGNGASPGEASATPTSSPRRSCPLLPMRAH